MTLTYYEEWMSAYLKVLWSYSGQSEVAIPASNFYYPEWVGSGVINVTITCPDGYTSLGTATTCAIVCGDNVKDTSEKCDDGNTSNGDGCSSACLVESGWVCSGGSFTSKDTCTQCAAGYYQNSPTTPTTCVTQCGDGKRVGTEA